MLVLLNIWQKFFFLSRFFFHDHSRITRLQGKGESISLTPHYHFHLLHRHFGISWTITAESSPLYIGSSQTRARNLWFPSASREPLSYAPFKALSYALEGIKKLYSQLIKKPYVYIYIYTLQILYMYVINVFYIYISFLNCVAFVLKLVSFIIWFVTFTCTCTVNIQAIDTTISFVICSYICYLFISCFFKGNVHLK